jgi:hypothetical protein
MGEDMRRRGGRERICSVELRDYYKIVFFILLFYFWYRVFFILSNSQKPT